jgi:hypothetical protein
VAAFDRGSYWHNSSANREERTDVAATILEMESESYHLSCASAPVIDPATPPSAPTNAAAQNFEPSRKPRKIQVSTADDVTPSRAQNWTPVGVTLLAV